MIKLTTLLNEVFDNPYKFSLNFKTEEIDEEDDEGNVYKKDVLSPVQIVLFKTSNGIPYLWYARQNRYDDKTWEVSFGIHKGQDERGKHSLNIELSNTGDMYRVFSTVIDITNRFIEFDSDTTEIQRLILSSKGDNRTKLYIKRILPRIENFELDSVRDVGDDTSEITLNRKF